MSQHDVPERLSNRAKDFAEDGGNQTMEVLVETLTGTAFEMTVSPSDTVLAIKSKIYRVEGIPVSQQHLLHKLVELPDGQSLGGAGVRPGGTLRLVLGLRGGPLGSRHLHTYPPHREEEWVGCLTGCRVAVVILRDGERVRVLRLGGGGQRPTPPVPPGFEPLSAVSPSPPAAVSPAAAPSPQDAVTMTKMAALRRRLEDLSLRRRPRHGGAADIHKTRSEETLAGHRSEVSDPTKDIDPADDIDFDADTAYAYHRLGASFADRGALLLPRGRGGGGGGPGSRPGGDGPLLHRHGFRDHTVPHTIAPPWWSSDSWLPTAAPAALPRHSGPAPAGSSPQLDTEPIDCMLPSLSRHGNREHLHLSDDGLHLTRPRPDLLPVAMETALPPVAMETAAPNRKQRLDRIRDMDRALRTLHQEHQMVERTPEAAGEQTLAAESRLPLPRLAEPAGTADGGGDKDGNTEKKRRVRCAWCRRRITAATLHRCRCGAQLCPPHRYREAHDCPYDYTAASGSVDPAATVRLTHTTLPRI